MRGGTIESMPGRKRGTRIPAAGTKIKKTISPLTFHRGANFSVGNVLRPGRRRHGQNRQKCKKGIASSVRFGTLGSDFSAKTRRRRPLGKTT
jgi:hypothetical protein